MSSIFDNRNQYSISRFDLCYRKVTPRLLSSTWTMTRRNWHITDNRWRRLRSLKTGTNWVTTTMKQVGKLLYRLIRMECNDGIYKQCSYVLDRNVRMMKYLFQFHEYASEKSKLFETSVKSLRIRTFWLQFICIVCGWLNLKTDFSHLFHPLSPSFRNIYSWLRLKV